MKQYDDTASPEERFSKRKDRQKPKGKQTVNDLRVDKDEQISSIHKFSDPDLQSLFERGYFQTIIGQLKSGKEATVYLLEGEQGLLAAKLYSDMSVRSFKDDRIYRQGRYISDQRIKKAIDKRSRSGLEAQQLLWIFHEYTQLWALYNAGLPVPKPMVGPGDSEFAEAGRVVLMEYIGDLNEPAPRLADVRLSAEDAQSAWQQSLDFLRALLKLGKVHGDYSTYNLLWWQDKVIAIDFPQMINIEENPDAMLLLERDVQSLCKSFKRHGINEEPMLLLHDLKQEAGLNNHNQLLR